MATHSSIVTWEMPWTEEPGGLQSMGSQRVGHNIVIEQQHSSYLVKSFCSFLSFSPSSLPLLPPFTLFVKSIFIPSFSSFLKINLGSRQCSLSGNQAPRREHPRERSALGSWLRIGFPSLSLGLGEFLESRAQVSEAPGRVKWDGLRLFLGELCSQGAICVACCWRSLGNLEYPQLPGQTGCRIWGK